MSPPIYLGIVKVDIKTLKTLLFYKKKSRVAFQPKTVVTSKGVYSLVW